MVETPYQNGMLFEAMTFLLFIHSPMFLNELLEALLAEGERRRHVGKPLRRAGGGLWQDVVVELRSFGLVVS